MIKPTSVAKIVFGALLSALLLCGDPDLAFMGPVAAQTGIATPSPDAAPPPAVPHARVYLFRGALGPIFSRGMDHLTERIEKIGITADVYEFTICRIIAAGAVREYREKPQPIILIGHSMGGYCALIFSEILEAENIPVSFVVTIDPPQISPEVPLNIERYLNIFLSKSVFGGSNIKAKRGFRGHFASFDLSEHEEVWHINIEKNDTIQEQLVSKVLQVATMSGGFEGETLPLRYVVPPSAAIDLWDSGMSVFARPGDSLQTIATFYHVPLWSVTQANKGAGNTPLVPGERVVVPRHMAPLAEVSAQSPPKR
ncbi:LysM domain-containing protein [Bradyrhizobium sp. dw_411]|uniref:LysM domain-containing protein n=1 Tax=Bradyrhizobium sp. dw_411 TaxID=2720082 RepID=UPI00201C08D2|nr:LysM domain-containing protein [Bradyrhizobium sp. dw_411]